MFLRRIVPHLFPFCALTDTIMDSELLAKRYERIRHKVIRYANQLFKAQGVRDVTMDDISCALHISKRTLYQLFKGKEGLVLACVKADVIAHRASRAEIETQTDDALEILFRNAEYKLKELHNLHPNYPRELRLFPSVVAFQEECRAEFLDNFRTLLQKGCAQGTIRSDLHFEQTTRGLIFMVDGAALYDAFADYTVRDFIFNILLVFIRGCATEKGVARIDEFIKRHRI